MEKVALKRWPGPGSAQTFRAHLAKESDPTESQRILSQRGLLGESCCFPLCFTGQDKILSLSSAALSVLQLLEVALSCRAGIHVCLSSGLLIHLFPAVLLETLRGRFRAGM